MNYTYVYDVHIEIQYKIKLYLIILCVQYDRRQSGGEIELDLAISLTVRVTCYVTSDICSTNNNSSEVSRQNKI